TVILPNSIDLADGTFLDDLGMTQNDWVDVTFLWVTAPSPPRRPTPSVTPKAAPTSSPSIPSGPTTLPSRAAGYNAPMPGTPLFLPIVSMDPTGWTTTWSIQNVSASPVSGTVEVYDVAGAPAGQLAFGLAPSGSDSFSLADLPG